ncbi:Cupin domain-containing protein [Amycolatopsis sulphurea]|uniref:Cupin domain-containing protein n=1 Tax=Amycolatopsis sulphurea TaxID=76022 RepID=A0A2A9G0V1_9PSEU|nr:cupin domain-containing protein [Amycolatopsis sulphurea]PFG57274.1 Cupin domain-containing protein [Amycolatopsis sulphurea]
MIVSRTHDGLTETFDGGLGSASWRCLGRRGMLFSECESFDYVRLAPGTALDGRGRGDLEEAWFVVSGRGEYSEAGEAPLRVREGQLVIVPHGCGGKWRAAEDSPLELLLMALMPAAVSRRLPTRTPAE